MNVCPSDIKLIHTLRDILRDTKINLKALISENSFKDFKNAHPHTTHTVAMKLTITNAESDQVFTVDLPSSLTVNDLKAYLESEMDISSNAMVISYNGKPITDNEAALEALGLVDDELLVVSRQSGFSQSSQSFNNNQTAVNDHIETLRQQYISNPQLSQQLSNTNPPLAAVLHKPTEFRQLVLTTMQQQHESQGLKQQELRKLQEDPDNPENQAKIMELINREAIEENMKTAMDMSPESFGGVNMLFIDCEVNNHPVKAFVDSGAQTTMMSSKMAQECGLERLIDRRFQGEARGVGSTPILGRIHSTMLKIENQYVACSLTILDTHVDFLLGLDMLKRHQALINLRKNVLEIAGVETRFLDEHEIPKIGLSGGSTGQEGFGGNIFSPEAAQPVSQEKKGPGNAEPEKVQQLVALGFGEKEAIDALSKCNNNVELAASLLFQ